ncbi:MAG: hypothetical protein ABJD68_09290 [Nakamurella sp.]
MQNVDWTVVNPYRWELDPYRSKHRPVDQDVPHRARGAAAPTRGPRYVPVAPIIVIMVVLMSSAPAGLVFLPLLVFGLVMVSTARQGSRRRHWEQRGMGQQPPTWSAPSAEPKTPAAAPAPTTTQPVHPAVGDEWPSRNPAVRSPFQTVAFWDEDLATTPRPAPAALTPPAWDPLGVAPFAWDLPEPPPLQPQRRRRRLQLGVGKLITAAVLMAAILVTAGDFAGWWPLDWAAAATSALAVVAIALIGGSLRQRVRR